MVQLLQLNPVRIMSQSFHPPQFLAQCTNYHWHFTWTRCSKKPCTCSALPAAGSSRTPSWKHLNLLGVHRAPEQSPRHLQHRAEGHKFAIFKWPQQQTFHSFCLKTSSQSKHVHCEKAFPHMQHFIINNSVTRLPFLTSPPSHLLHGTVLLILLQFWVKSWSCWM